MTPESPWKYFSYDELKCRCGKCQSDGTEMDNDIMDKLMRIRIACDFRFPVTSAYRCPEHNAEVSNGRVYGAHTLGKAVDIAVRGDKAYEVIKYALMDGFTGIGVAQKGPHRFVHIDTCTFDEIASRPTVWSY